MNQHEMVGGHGGQCNCIFPLVQLGHRAHHYLAPGNSRAPNCATSPVAGSPSPGRCLRTRPGHLFVRVVWVLSEAGAPRVVSVGSGVRRGAARGRARSPGALQSPRHFLEHAADDRLVAGRDLFDQRPQALFDRSWLRLIERLPRRGQLQMPAAAVLGSGSAGNKAAPLEPLQDSGERARMNVKSVGQLTGAQAGAVADDPERNALRSAEADGLLHRFRTGLHRVIERPEDAQEFQLRRK